MVLRKWLCLSDVKLQSVDAWTEKLRKWLGRTIMVRLVKEIEDINRNLVKLGCEDMEIGEVHVSSHGKSLTSSSSDTCSVTIYMYMYNARNTCFCCSC